MKKEPKKRAFGGGRPKSYGEETVRLTFRCPITKRKEFRELVNKILKTYKKQSLNTE